MRARVGREEGRAGEVGEGACNSQGQGRDVLLASPR